MGPECAASFSSRHLPLPGERTMCIRPIGPGDLDGLVFLYETLAEDDLYRRFFQGRMPPRSAIESMTSVEERGGFRLIAEIQDGHGNRRIVGECGYEVLPDGDGEFGITVAPEARGWLGPYLLDVLTEVAASRGVANLEADVLLDNRRMLSLIHARGYATMEHSLCPAIVRAIIGTAQRVPTWPVGDPRPRVLVEVAGARWHAEEAARSAGFQLLACPGPLSKWSRCPAVSGRPCPLAAQADLIVDSVPPDPGPGEALLEAHSQLHAGVPLCMELAADAGPATWRAELTRDMDDATIVRLLERMARRSRATVTPPVSDARPSNGGAST